MIIDGLYVPPIGFFGFPHLGEDVWGPNAKTKIARLETLREGSAERQALLETLYDRSINE